REPGGTDVSEMIRGMLLNPEIDIDPVTELLLFSSARSQLVAEKVRPLLKENVIVILDRFYDSTIAYQGFGRESM
ncbi:MAG TPA: dTMP kinase, partial [Balneolaceae bacterium]|nr:dTMP kinase [Balneolaceae bacterium]